MTTGTNDAPATLRVRETAYAYDETPDNGRLVMVVDDDYAIREALADVLSGLGYRVVLANHGEHAISLLDAGCQPFAILLDLGMPVMDGWQLKNFLLSKPEYAGIRIIVITAANCGRGDVSGATEVLTKPIPLQRLIDALNEGASSA